MTTRQESEVLSGRRFNDAISDPAAFANGQIIRDFSVLNPYRRNGYVLRALVILLVLATSCCSTALSRAVESDKQYETRFTTIRYNNQEDLLKFTEALGGGWKFFFAGNPGKDPFPAAANRVDTLVFTVMKILDVHPEDFHMTILVYAKASDINRAYTALEQNGKPPLAYYYHPTKTIALSLDSVTRGVLAHEIAHAIICASFSPSPPAAIQEILAQYVDRHLDE